MTWKEILDLYLKLPPPQRNSCWVKGLNVKTKMIKELEHQKYRWLFFLCDYCFITVWKIFLSRNHKKKSDIIQKMCILNFITTKQKQTQHLPLERPT